MKPHEERWQVRSECKCCVVDAEGYPVADDCGVDAANLISAAPDMARALLELMPEKDGSSGAERHTPSCWETYIGEPCLPECELARAALKKAGVLP